MRNLAKDLVEEGGIYEPPLVHAHDGAFVVYDGNRRVTCLKMLNSPQHAPSEDWRDFFLKIRKEWTGEFSLTIPCQVEEDRDRIDEILYRRHTGGQSGVGQSQWDAEAKSHFVKRTGKKSQVNVAEEIDQKLKEANYLKENDKLPRSNLSRLLSAEGFRNRVGISVRKNHVEFTHHEAKVLSALARISQDLISKKIVLDDIWSNQDKKYYLDALEKEGVLPTAEHALNQNTNFKTSGPVTKPGHTKLGPGPVVLIKARRTLIREDIDYALAPELQTRRIMDIWNELQYRLKFDDHGNAIAVLFRVLLELCVEEYIRRKQISSVSSNEKLAKKFRVVLDHLLADGAIDKKYHEELQKFEHAEPILSANTMHKYVHSKNFFPSDHHLRAMWDTLSIFVLQCLKA